MDEGHPSVQVGAGGAEIAPKRISQAAVRMLQNMILRFRRRRRIAAAALRELIMGICGRCGTDGVVAKLRTRRFE
jgi:hypothetical protein